MMHDADGVLVGKPNASRCMIFDDHQYGVYLLARAAIANPGYRITQNAGPRPFLAFIVPALLPPRPPSLPSSSYSALFSLFWSPSFSIQPDPKIPTRTSMLSKSFFVAAAVSALALAAPFKRDIQFLESITVEQLLAIAPASAACDPAAQFADECITAQDAVAPLNAAFAQYGVETVGEKAALLSLMLFESGDFKVHGTTVSWWHRSRWLTVVYSFFTV